MPAAARKTLSLLSSQPITLWKRETPCPVVALVALYVAWCNLCRTHMTLRVTPAMEAGIADHVWTLEKLMGGSVPRNV